jgi:hypothetical protein
MNSREAKRFARLRAHIATLRSRTTGEKGKKLSPERRKEIMTYLTAAIKRLTIGRKL